MLFSAYGSIERQPDGRWLCRQATTVSGPYGPVDVKAGQVFMPNSSFAGFDDFTEHLQKVATLVSAKPPHAWG